MYWICIKSFLNCRFHGIFILCDLQAMATFFCPGFTFRICKNTTRALWSLFTVDTHSTALRVREMVVFLHVFARVSSLPCVFSDGCTVYYWSHKVLPAYTEHIVYWHYLRSWCLNKLMKSMWGADIWCLTVSWQMFLLCNLPPPPASPNPRVCLCLHVILLFLFQSNRT